MKVKYILLTVLGKIRYHIKLHQNLTGSFHVIGNFLTQKYENRSRSKV